MARRCWPLLLPLLLAGPAGPGPLQAQPQPQALPDRVAVPDVRLPGAGGSVAPEGVAPEGGTPAPALAYPLAQLAEAMDPWGWRYSDWRAAWRLHTGVDLAAAQGTPVLAAAAGRVLLVEAISGYGTTVLLDHGDGWQTLYAHLLSAAVQPGTWAESGQALGAVGMTGSASGPHLHFELRRQGAELLAWDPTPHLPPLLPPPLLPPVLATIER